VWLLRVAELFSYDFQTILHFADAGGRHSLASPSPHSILVSLHRPKCGCSLSLHSDGCHHCRHLHRHFHMRVAPTVCPFSCDQVLSFALSDFGHQICEAHLLPGVVLIVACWLADASGQSRLPPQPWVNPLLCVESCVRPPPAVEKRQGSSLGGQFNVEN